MKCKKPSKAGSLHIVACRRNLVHALWVVPVVQGLVIPVHAQTSDVVVPPRVPPVVCQPTDSMYCNYEGNGQLFYTISISAVGEVVCTNVQADPADQVEYSGMNVEGDEVSFLLDGEAASFTVPSLCGVVEVSLTLTDSGDIFPMEVCL